MESDERISKLLRLKRYEKPSPDYFEDFLAEFQLRQRAEVIHRPFWKIAWDRLAPIFVLPPVSRLVTVGSMAAAVVATTLALNWSDTSPLTQKSRDKKSSIAKKSGRSGKNPGSIQYVLPEKPVTYASSRSF